MRISRNRCQYCRMQRCISAGMSHEAVRLGRCPKKDKPKRLDFFKLPKNQQGTVDVDKQIKSEQMVLNIHNSFRMALNGDACDLLSHMAITKDMNRDEISALCSKYLAEVVKFVTFFARELPQFTELGMEDQRMLIKSSLLEICVIHYVIYSSENDLLNLNILKLEDNSEKSDLICDLMKVLCSCTKKLLKLNLTEVEYAILAALLLFCPDRENIQHVKVMEGLEDELSQALRCQLLLNHKEKALMFPKLVEVIVDIRAISTTFLEDIMMAQVEVSD
ncbi:hypothetical protein FSP39_016581 [Pinctada imbricata]|uniref:NR LBD domain-containing protein n=1 Tax=Pinctada imbricata TaxID=66713 RepID=A0AA88XLC8_PINIB|nr:hypothetical protein FSP39_016581 [Pinctada imbricata]